MLMVGSVWGQIGPFQVYEGLGTQALPSQGGTWASTSITYNNTSNSRSGLYCLTFDGAGDVIRTPQLSSPGVFSFWYKRSSNTAASSLTIETSPDNTIWTTRGTVTNHTTTYQQYNINLGALSLTNVYVRIKDTRASGTAARYLDDISWTSTTTSENTILIQGFSGTVNLTSGIIYTLYDIGGVNDQYNVSQSSAPIVLAPPTGYVVNANITSLGTESGYDYLKLYNGNSISASALHSGTGFSGNTAPGSFTSNHSSGVLTFDFTSDGSTNGSGFIATITTSLAPTCMVPTALTTSTISSTTATIGWTSPATGTIPASYDYEVRTSGAAGSGATGLIVSGSSSTSSANITGLTAATSYSFYVRSNCGGGDLSSWTTAGSFVTACNVPNFPGAITVSSPSSTGFTLTYSAASPAPTSYVLFNTTGTSVAATTVPSLVNGTNYSSSTSYSLGGNSYNCVSTASVSPQSLTGGVSNTQYNYFLFSRNATNSCSGNPYYSTGVTVSAVTCAATPTLPVNSAVTSNSATVSWTASALGGGMGTINYTLEVYSNSGYTTHIVGSPYSMSTSLSQSLTGLSSTTTYYYRIKADNGYCSSTYLTGSFTTLCAAVSTFPWTESFESVSVGSTTVGASTSLPSCWNSQSTKWSSSDATTYNTAKTGSKYIRYIYTTTNAYIWTPGFQLTAGVSYDFSFYAQGDGYTGWTNDVFVNSSVSSTGATQLTPTYTPAGTGTIAIQSYNLVTRTFVPATTGVYYFAIRGNQSSSAPWYMAFDDFRLEETPNCMAPTSLAVASVISSGATVSWSAPSSTPSNGYEIYYSTSSTAPISSTTASASISTGTSYDVLGLNDASTYYTWVRSVCNSSDKSNWASAPNFTTLCNAISSFPWTEGFEGLTGVSTTTFPVCWLEGTGSNWASLTNATSSYNDPKTGSKYIGCNYGGTNDRIWTPGFQLTAGVSYDFSTYFVGDGYSGWTGNIVYNTTATSTGETVLGNTFISSSTNSTSGVNYVQVLRTFVPSVTGVYFFGIRITATNNPYSYLAFDDFKLDLTPAPAITSVTSSNLCATNTKIVITGTDLNNISSATIGSQTLLPFDSTSSTRLVKTITTPLNGTTSITNNIGAATNATNITFTNAPTLSLDSNNFNICSGSSASVNVTSTLTDYTSYTWSPATSVSGSTSATVNPTTTTTYTLSATNSGTGCVNSLTRTVTVDQLPSAITLSQGRTTATCYSGFDSLMVSGGLVSGSYGKIGTGISSNTTSTPFKRYWGGSKSQALYTPSELSALGLVAGSEISSIGWVALSGTPAAMANMNISIGLISSTLSSTNFSTSPSNMVFSSATYTPSTGIGNLDFALSTPLVWDGTSHLLIETCFNNSDAGAGSTSNSVSVESSTVASGLNIYNSIDNNASVCATTTGTASTTRPNLRLSYSKPATYSWSPNTGLFTNRATTTAYAGTSLNKVYSKPTVSQKYYLTATNGACQRRDSIVDSIKNASNLIVLASANATGAVEQCADANGWTYYGTAANPDEWLFGIYKNGSNFTATVDITVDPANKFRKNTSSNGANQEHASYIMSRYWNVNATGTVGAGVKVRFFLDPQDITDLLDERDNDYDVLKNNTNSSTLAVKGGFEWFKTTGTVYNPTNWTGNKHNGTIMKLTQDSISTLNGQTYVELSGITSFSGGSGGSSFGPSNNVLFNSGGTVGLPVTWKDVKATAKETGNHIEWSTSSEKNTKSFVVEYSYDAKEFFEASKDIIAAGNSATERFYEFNHEEEYGELVYYRIKQIDLDGKVDYSKAVVVKRTTKLPEFHVSMYPVPLNVQDLTVRIQTVQKTDIAISINDLLGRDVYSETISPTGYNTDHKMNLNHLPQGTYHVTINNGVNKSVQVLVVGK